MKPLLHVTATLAPKAADLMEPFPALFEFATWDAVHGGGGGGYLKLSTQTAMVKPPRPW